MSNVNTVVITGNLTRDPELRYAETNNEFVCKLRVAVNGRRKDAESGGWVNRPNYFDAAVWGEHAHTCANYLLKGRGIAGRWPPAMARVARCRRSPRRRRDRRDPGSVHGSLGAPDRGDVGGGGA